MGTAYRRVAREAEHAALKHVGTADGVPPEGPVEEGDAAK